jgi:hypothetical protein
MSEELARSLMDICTTLNAGVNYYTDEPCSGEYNDEPASVPQPFMNAEGSKEQKEQWKLRKIHCDSSGQYARRG